jgi:hypothetical protein
MALPLVDFKPGAVTRSLLLSMSAVTPMIRQERPTVPKLLDEQATVPLPTDWKLYVARLGVAAARFNRSRSRCRTFPLNFIQQIGPEPPLDPQSH